MQSYFRYFGSGKKMHRIFSISEFLVGLTEFELKKAQSIDVKIQFDSLRYKSLSNSNNLCFCVITLRSHINPFVPNDPFFTP